MTVNGYTVFLGGDESVLKLMVVTVVKLNALNTIELYTLGR